ncbi:hydantoinase/oxoprolinase family protein [Paracoccaceae bacterium]|nr:hydantoinase/oxoprolinase family protein [Paracoccaceae bacterium]
MSFILGVDTGGTYTDAVILEDEERVIAFSKALTTHSDLSLGIGLAIQKAIKKKNTATEKISLVSLSTTLATNALVEGQGDRVALVMIGFQDSDLEKHSIFDALKGDPFLVIEGGHNYAGFEKSPLAKNKLSKWISGIKGVSAYAVCSQFAVRNPEHELEAAEIIRKLTDKPVSLSHQISAKLNGPKRALTAVLNARLIALIDLLIIKAEHVIKSLGILAPLMVVRGDGALISAAQAREKPIETILSGPAASIVGARWLTGETEAIISDIGGTTTDIAVLKGGKPAIDPRGASVGPYRTMVEAVAMYTFGLGGDSEVKLELEGLGGHISLGPKRVIPVALAASIEPDFIHQTLDSQLKNETPNDFDARFIRRTRASIEPVLSERDDKVYRRIGEQFYPMSEVIKSRLDLQSVIKLVSMGVAQISAVTPSDASHVLGKSKAWDKEAAIKAIDLFARRRNGSGELLAGSTAQMAERIVCQLTDQTSSSILEMAFSEEKVDFGDKPDVLAKHPLIQFGLAGYSDLIKVNVGISKKIIGLGASAPTYYPAVGAELNCEVILPEYAGVANAIGAVVGKIVMRESGVISSPSEGKYLVHLDGKPVNFTSEVKALKVLEEKLTEKSIQKAKEAGAENVSVNIDREIKTANIENRSVFVEASVLVEASGRPRISKS